MSLKRWEIIDIECAFVFYAETVEGRDSFKQAITLLGHTAVVHEYELHERNAVAQRIEEHYRDKSPN